jgi:hypothetical protein
MSIKKFTQFINEWHDNLTPPDDNRRFSEPDNSGEWNVVAVDGEHAVAEKGDKTYLVYYGHVSKDEFAEHASREIETEEDEDGKYDSYSDDFDVDADAVQGWLNAKSDVKVGSGMDDWESGDFDAVEASEEVVASVKDLVERYGHGEASKRFISVLDGIVGN